MMLDKNPLFNLFVSLRPRQWIKNLVVFSALIFSRDLFIADKFLPVLYTFFIFSACSSGLYLINDLVDKSSDTQHYKKKFRPIAAGKLSTKSVVFFAFLLLSGSLLFASQISNYLLLIVLLYIAVQISYSLFLKKVIILDVLTISFAFMLRIFAGSLVILAPLSAWLILTTFMLATFLSVGKRRSEMTLLLAQNPTPKVRFLPYPKAFLDGLVFMMGTATIITYSLFSFNSRDLDSQNLLSGILPSTLSSAKVLMLTIPLVLFGIFRYLYLIFEKTEGDSPEKVLLSDAPLFISVLLWVILVIFFLYLLPF